MQDRKQKKKKWVMKFKKYVDYEILKKKTEEEEKKRKENIGGDLEKQLENDLVTESLRKNEEMKLTNPQKPNLNRNVYQSKKKSQPEREDSTPKILKQK